MVNCIIYSEGLCVLKYNSQIGSTHMTHRKPITEIGVIEEMRQLLQRSEQGSRQLLLSSWAPQGVRAEGSYRQKLGLGVVCVQDRRLVSEVGGLSFD